MKRAEFPKVIRVGQTKASIYKTPTHDCDSFTVACYGGAVRKRKAFAGITAAEIHASSKVHNLSKGEAKILHLSGEEPITCVRAKETEAIASTHDTSLRNKKAPFRAPKILLQVLVRLLGRHQLDREPGFPAAGFGLVDHARLGRLVERGAQLAKGVGGDILLATLEGFRVSPFQRLETGLDAAVLESLAGAIAGPAFGGFCIRHRSVISS